MCSQPRMYSRGSGAFSVVSVALSEAAAVLCCRSCLHNSQYYRTAVSFSQVQLLTVSHFGLTHENIYPPLSSDVYLLLFFSVLRKHLLFPHWISVSWVFLALTLLRLHMLQTRQLFYLCLESCGQLKDGPGPAPAPIRLQHHIFQHWAWPQSKSREQEHLPHQELHPTREINTEKGLSNLIFYMIGKEEGKEEGKEKGERGGKGREGEGRGGKGRGGKGRGPKMTDVSQKMKKFVHITSFYNMDKHND